MLKKYLRNTKEICANVVLTAFYTPLMLSITFWIINAITNDSEGLTIIFQKFPIAVIIVNTIIGMLISGVMIYQQINDAVAMSITRKELCNAFTLVLFIAQIINLACSVLVLIIAMYIASFFSFEMVNIFDLIPIWSWIALIFAFVAIVFLGVGSNLFLRRKTNNILYLIFFIVGPILAIVSIKVNDKNTVKDSDNSNMQLLHNVDLSIIIVIFSVSILLYFLGRKMIKNYSLS